jgi:hypothetical protein
MRFNGAGTDGRAVPWAFWPTGGDTGRLWELQISLGELNWKLECVYRRAHDTSEER